MCVAMVVHFEIRFCGVRWAQLSVWKRFAPYVSLPVDPRDYIINSTKMLLTTSISAVVLKSANQTPQSTADPKPPKGQPARTQVQRGGVTSTYRCDGNYYN
eukprot:1987856-Amphidinium_carterae.1